MAWLSGVGSDSGSWKPEPPDLATSPDLPSSRGGLSQVEEVDQEGLGLLWIQNHPLPSSGDISRLAASPLPTASQPFSAYLSEGGDTGSAQSWETWGCAHPRCSLFCPPSLLPGTEAAQSGPKLRLKTGYHTWLHFPSVWDLLWPQGLAWGLAQQASGKTCEYIATFFYLPDLNSCILGAVPLP